MSEKGRGNSVLSDILEIPTEGKDKPHEFFISILVEMLYENGYKDLNFDHIKGKVPKNKSVPVQTEDGRCDIAVGLKDDLFAQIEVEIRCAQE